MNLSISINFNVEFKKYTYKKKPSGKYLSMSTTKEDDVEMHYHLEKFTLL